jgi:hypothetical protein
MTGRYPNSHGTWRNGIPLSTEETTIADRLSNAGYQTGLLGKAHFTPYRGNPEIHPESVQTIAVDEEECWDYWRNFNGPYYGFEHVEMTIAHGHRSVHGGHYGLWLEENHPEAKPLFQQEAALDDTDPAVNSWKSAAPLEAHSSTWVADRTIEFIEQNAGDQPFFGWVGFPDPHFPYDPPEPYCHRYDPEEVPLPVDPAGEVWLHWLAWNIDPGRREIPEARDGGQAVQGVNDFEERGYGGPAPPDREHTYRFKGYAIDRTLDLPVSASKATVGDAMAGGISAQTHLEATFAP